MKKILYLLAFIPALAFAGGPPVVEVPIIEGNGAETVAASTSAWTAGWSSSYAAMTGVYMTNKSTNTSNMYVILSTYTPTTSIGIGPIVLKPGLTQFHNISSGVTAYFRSLATSAEYVDLMRVKQ